MSSDDFGAAVGGSPFSDCTIKLTNVRFNIDPRFKDYGTDDLSPLLFADVVFEDGDVIQDKFYLIGDRFEIVDGGDAVESKVKKDNGPSKGFGDKSYMQKFLQGIIDVDGEGVRDWYEKCGSGPRTAKFWEGLTVEFQEFQEVYGKPDIETGARKTKNAPKVVRVLGYGPTANFREGVTVTEAKTEAVTPAKAAAANTFGIENATYVKLSLIAANAPDFNTFIEAAYGLDEIGDEGVMDAVDDDVNGIWGQK